MATGICYGLSLHKSNLAHLGGHKGVPASASQAAQSQRPTATAAPRVQPAIVRHDKSRCASRGHGLYSDSRERAGLAVDRSGQILALAVGNNLPMESIPPTEDTAVAAQAHGVRSL